MPTDDAEVWVQLATRIPKQLHRDIKLYCVEHECSVMSFVTAAISERLASSARPATRTTGRRGTPRR